MSIKKWDTQDRPREKLIEQGVKRLTDAELLAILIGSGNTKQNAVELARDILDGADNNLFRLGQKTIDDFVTAYNGIGTAKAVTIVAAMELGRRRKDNEYSVIKITSSTDVYDFFYPLIGDANHEEFWVLYLNRANRVIAKEQISSGGTAGTVVDEKLIIRSALLKYAESLILCHNHPSGNINPSEQDKVITQKIKSASAFFSIKLLDHIIVTGNGFFSFADTEIL